MILLGGFLVALAWSLMLWSGSREVFARPVFQRENYRGARVPTGVGILGVAAVLFTEALLVLADALGVAIDAEALAATRLTTFAVVGFGLVGFLDDLAQDRGVEGYRGHLAALARGRVTGGGLKVLGGAAVSLVVVAPAAGGSVGRLLLDGALVALCANLANLFDRAPGRTTKVALVCVGAVVAAAGPVSALAGLALAVGATVGLLVGDLRERLMLGDAGANALGGAIGLAVVLAFSPTTRTVVLLVVAALNLASEVVSFSRIIERTPPLRALDRLGRGVGDPEQP